MNKLLVWILGLMVIGAITQLFGGVYAIFTVLIIALVVMVVRIIRDRKNS